MQLSFSFLFFSVMSVLFLYLRHSRLSEVRHTAREREKDGEKNGRKWRIEEVSLRQQGSDCDHTAREEERMSRQKARNFCPVKNEGPRREGKRRRKKEKEENEQTKSVRARGRNRVDVSFSMSPQNDVCRWTHFQCDGMLLVSSFFYYFLLPTFLALSPYFVLLFLLLGIEILCFYFFLSVPCFSCGLLRD